MIESSAMQPKFLQGDLKPLLSSLHHILEFIAHSYPISGLEHTRRQMNLPNPIPQTRWCHVIVMTCKVIPWHPIAMQFLFPCHFHVFPFHAMPCLAISMTCHAMPLSFHFQDIPCHPISLAFHVISMPWRTMPWNAIFIYILMSCHAIVMHILMSSDVVSHLNLYNNKYNIPWNYSRKKSNQNVDQSETRITKN